MKIGIEVEGRLKGIPTLFCNASEFLNKKEIISNLLHAYSLQHLYISDHENTLSYQIPELTVSPIITIEVSQVSASARLKNLMLMYRIDKTPVGSIVFDSLARLIPTDQIKIEKNKKVFVWTMNSAIITEPTEFEEDKEITKDEIEWLEKVLP